ncbi:MAG: hypothetical protein DRH43_00080 [Deltaproteobacteria bacterium]|nr:MAG: hypothetical protein DRH43_00080 [Deltaproteobacteria bacterium]
MNFISTDVAVPGLNRDFAHSRLLLVADQKILRLFEDTVSLLHQQMELLKRQNASLTKARDLLPPPPHERRDRGMISSRISTIGRCIFDNWTIINLQLDDICVTDSRYG